MPLGSFESEVLRLLATNRNPESYIGGATVLHQNPESPRASLDIDVFHDTAEALRQAVEQDLATLKKHGYDVSFTQQQQTFCRATVTKDLLQTKLEWVQDSAFRFFPVEPDAELGWKLNFWDVATNKVLALAGRDKLRDLLDVMYLHKQHLHFGALVWAAAAKDAGMTPELILDCARRFGRFPATAADWIAMRLTPPQEITVLKKEFLEMTWSAQALVEKLPPAEMGCFYLDSDRKPVCPIPGTPDFLQLTRHFGSVKGAWPSIISE